MFNLKYVMFSLYPLILTIKDMWQESPESLGAPNILGFKVLGMCT